MTNELKPSFLLRGVAGSTAHGLATPESDQDQMGVFGWPTEAFYGLTQPKESIVGNDPEDHTYHEVGKFLRLGLSSNPMVLELLWLEKYEEQDVWGNLFREHRKEFLHTDGVRNAFGGYARSQIRKATAGNPSAQRYKNIRHMFRLLEEGTSLLTTGDMSVRVSDPAWYFSLKDLDPTEWEPMFEDRISKFDTLDSVLPDKPNRELINSLLISYRKAH
jgi:predicted nucleotidyltransferase